MPRSKYCVIVTKIKVAAYSKELKPGPKKSSTKQKIKGAQKPKNMSYTRQQTSILSIANATAQA